MVTLDPYLIIPDNPALIIQWPTGVRYEVQAGGMACNHPSCEGFLLALPESFEKFDDCSYGCYYINRKGNEENTARLAADLDIFLKRQTVYWTYQLAFDFTRQNELMEGWWPVTMKGKYQGQSVDWKGYIHTGNCD